MNCGLRHGDTGPSQQGTQIILRTSPQAYGYASARIRQVCHRRWSVGLFVHILLTLPNAVYARRSSKPLRQIATDYSAATTGSQGWIDDAYPHMQRRRAFPSDQRQEMEGKGVGAVSPRTAHREARQEGRWQKPLQDV